MATTDKILRKSNFAAAMTALIAKLNSLLSGRKLGKAFLPMIILPQKKQSSQA